MRTFVSPLSKSTFLQAESDLLHPSKLIDSISISQHLLLVLTAEAAFDITFPAMGNTRTPTFMT